LSVSKEHTPHTHAQRILLVKRLELRPLRKILSAHTIPYNLITGINLESLRFPVYLSFFRMTAIYNDFDKGLGGI